MSDKIYEMLNTRKDIYWFCGTCERRVLQNIHIDKDMEQRCSEYLRKLEEKVNDRMKSNRR